MLAEEEKRLPHWWHFTRSERLLIGSGLGFILVVCEGLVADVSFLGGCLDEDVLFTAGLIVKAVFILAGNLELPVVEVLCQAGVFVVNCVINCSLLSLSSTTLFSLVD